MHETARRLEKGVLVTGEWRAVKRGYLLSYTIIATGSPQVRDGETVQWEETGWPLANNRVTWCSSRHNDTHTRSHTHTHASSCSSTVKICDTIGAADQQWKNSSSLLIHISGVNYFLEGDKPSRLGLLFVQVISLLSYVWKFYRLF